MWNKLVDILQQPASKRLGFAICVSAVLHTLFFGKLELSLPAFKNDMHLIEARIQKPKVVAKPIADRLPDAQTKSIEPIMEPDEDVQEAKELSTPAVALPVPEPVAEAEQKLPLPDAEPLGDVEPSLVPEDEDVLQLQEGIGLVMNENAYQYVQTEFDVRTAIDGNAVGKATITYDLIENMQYRIRWLTKGTGIMALLFPELLQTSDGELTQFGLRPDHYLYQYGKKADKSRSASFDWQTKTVSLQTAKDTKIVDLPEGTQDLLSFMYQFMHVPPLQRMQLPIVNGKKLRIYDYSFEGEEQINSALGELRTLHILHSGSNEEEKTELWLAIDFQNVPVKIRKIEDDGSVVEMLVTRMSTNPLETTQ
jgi:hypothetical protein